MLCKNVLFCKSIFYIFNEGVVELLQLNIPFSRFHYILRNNLGLWN
jgi:hypothetical protein